MSRIRSVLNPKLTLAAAAIFAAGAIYVASLPKSDAIYGPMVCTYYSNYSFRAAVGARGTDCCGAAVKWGVTSAYKVCSTLKCSKQTCDLTVVSDRPE